MGKSMFNFGKQAKEKARQQKQIEKAAKRILAKQQKAKINNHTPNPGSDMAELESVDEVVKSVQ
jgi:hypothetical protein